MVAISPILLLSLAVLALAAIAGCAWLAVAIERASVTRHRLERFAQRHRLLITADNGNQVIRYLATTRRWRAIGLAFGLVGSIAWSLTHGAFRVDFLTLFAGWFAGALVAELRLTSAVFGPRRAASLAPRAPGVYLARSARALLPAAAGVSLAAAGTAAIAAVQGRPVAVAAAPLFAIAVTVVIVVRAVQRRVLHRPQPVAEPDVLAADDAIRSRSLHVLAGGGAALVLYCVLGQVAALVPALPDTATQVIAVVNFLGIFVVPLLGWSIATVFWPVRRATAPTSVGVLPSS